MAEARWVQALLYQHFTEGRKQEQNQESDFQGLLDLIRKNHLYPSRTFTASGHVQRDGREKKCFFNVFNIAFLNSTCTIHQTGRELGLNARQSIKRLRKSPRFILSFNYLTLLKFHLVNNTISLQVQTVKTNFTVIFLLSKA